MKTAEMTHYEKLVQEATTSMNRHPKSTLVLDADTLHVLARSSNPEKAAAAACRAAEQGRMPIIVERPRRDETWIL